MRFSTKFLHVTLVTLLGLTAASCAYIIPPEANAPRNNEVMGDRRKPQLNTSGSPQSARPMPEHYATAPMMPSPQDAQASRDLAFNGIGAVPEVNPQMGERRVPVENMEFQMASNDTYPPINSVPSRPAMSGPESAQERLNETKSTLEQDRSIAIENKAALDRDAAAEPSMLSDLPPTDGVVPPNDPVGIVPVVNPAPHSAVPSVVVPTPNDIRPRPVLAPSSRVIAPPPVAVQPVAAATKHIAVPLQAPVKTYNPPIPVAAMPVATVERVQPAMAKVSAPVIAAAPVMPPEIIAAAPPPPPVVVAPVQETVAVVAPAPQQVVQVAEPVAVAAVAPPALMPVAPAPTVKRGDFDPLAAAANAPLAAPAATTRRGASIYASSGYIPTSRYAERRY